MERLTDAEIGALNEALDDEYRAFATYDQVVHDFGPIRPFVNIRGAEQRHIDALRALFDRYGIPIPVNPWPGRVTRYDSVAAACAAGVDAEVENAALYDRLLASTTRDDLRRVFTNLAEASQQRHLPAFRRCLARGVAGRGDPAPAGGPRARVRRRRGHGC